MSTLKLHLLQKEQPGGTEQVLDPSTPLLKTLILNPQVRAEVTELEEDFHLHSKHLGVKTPIV